MTGEQPGQSALRDIDVATGDSTVLMDIDPVVATYSGIAVDGTSVYTADDSAYQGALRSRTADPDTRTVGEPTLLARREPWCAAGLH